MATRQYIGARYVPKYVGVWSESTAYEPLSIVQDANGNSYTSKKSVPAGTSLSNTDYWIQSANFNAQIEQLEQTIEDVSDSLDTNVAALSTRITANTNGITKMRGNVKPGTNIVFIGDSWVVGSGASSAANRFTTLLAARLGLNEFNYGVGASGFTISGNTFAEQITAAYNGMTSSERANTSIVLIIGGVNDLRHMSGSTSGDYANAVSQCAIAAQTRFPNALIVVAQGTQTKDTTASYTQWNWIDSADRYLEWITGSNRFIKIIHHIGNVLSGQDFFQSDNLHPTDSGHKLLAGFLANVLCGGSEQYTRYVSTAFTFNEQVSTNPAISHLFKNNDFISITRGFVTFASAITTNTLIGTYNFIQPEANLHIPCYISNTLCGTLIVTTGGNVYFNPIDSSAGVSSCRWNDFVFMYNTASGSN